MFIAVYMYPYGKYFLEYSWNIPGIFELGPDNTPGAGIARAGEGGDRNFGMHLVPVSGGETEVEDRALASPGGDAAVLHCH
jgi:hypothetical protein